MEICRVLGPAPANLKHPSLTGLKLSLVKPEHNRGPALVAWDRVDAGPGDRVLVMVEGSSAIGLLGRGPAPIRTVIIGQIDRVDI
jgi:microcompartment protein CcmK/EutM